MFGSPTIFQSTFPQGERRLVCHSVKVFIPISIHVPTRGTTYLGSPSKHQLNISIHVPTRGTTPESYIKRLDSIFQSTFPQGERPTIVRINDGSLPISIHVPTRGTTSLIRLADCACWISIHVPTRGTTCYKSKWWRSKNISIHVPTRGTTSGNQLVSRHLVNFNPRSHKGNDGSGGGQEEILRNFNPRSHKGNDLYSLIPRF